MRRTLVLAALLSASFLFLWACRPMVKTVATLATPTPGPAEGPPVRPRPAPRATARPSAPRAAPTPTPVPTTMPIVTAPASIYEQTPGVLYERSLPPASRTTTPTPGPHTPTRKPGVYYEDNTPTPTRTPR